MANARVLVVDDEPDIRQTVKEILEDEGYLVNTADSAQRRARHGAGSVPDVVLLDIWMPDLDGISLLREWNERGGLPCPVIMMSGHGTVETAVEATRLGRVGFHRETHLAGQTSAGRLARARSEPPQTRERRSAASAVRTDRTDRHQQGMQALRAQLDRLAAHDTWVLIRGEARHRQGNSCALAA